MFQSPDKRDICDSGASLIVISNKNQAATRLFDNTSNGCAELGLGDPDMVLPKLCGEQPKNIGKVFR